MMESISARSMLMAILISVWSCRLTYNFYRKGGYTAAGEDYRWQAIRDYLQKKGIRGTMYRLTMTAFNFAFISSYQNYLLLLLAMPVALVEPTQETRALNLMDLVALLVFVIAIVGETVADEQQWAFQTEKKRKKEAGEKLVGDYKNGFITSGLFAYSRHPNFFCEQLIWVAIYLFIPAATGSLLFTMPASGCIQLCLLFQGSTWLTELISASKYPQYAQYKQRVSMLLPMPPSRAASTTR